MRRWADSMAFKTGQARIKPKVVRLTSAPTRTNTRHRRAEGGSQRQVLGRCEFALEIKPGGAKNWAGGSGNRTPGLSRSEQGLHGSAQPSGVGSQRKDAPLPGNRRIPGPIPGPAIGLCSKPSWRFWSAPPTGETLWGSSPPIRCGPALHVFGSLW